MIRALKSELTRMRRGSYLGGLILMAFFILMSVVIVFSRGSDGAGSGGGGAGPFNVTDPLAPGGFLAGIGTSANLIGIVALAYWAISAAGDYNTGLIRILAQAQPKRLKLLAGKVGALTLYTMIGTAIVVILGIAAAFGLAGPFDVSTNAWSSDWIPLVAAAWFDLTLSAIVWGLIGLTIAILTRSSGIAIAVGIGYMMVVEGLLGLLGLEFTDWLPGGVLSALSLGGTEAMSYGTALLMVAGYAVVAVAISATVQVRRDITY